MKQPTGALVSSVRRGGPAQAAGLKAGDVVLALNGTPIEHVDALGYRLATQPIGGIVQLPDPAQAARRRRSTSRWPSRPKARRRPRSSSRAAAPSPAPRSRRCRRRLAQRLGLRADTTGVTVVDIDARFAGRRFRLPAARHRARGQRRGDQLGRAAGRQIAGQQTRWWRFTVERDGQMLRQMLRY